MYSDQDHQRPAHHRERPNHHGLKVGDIVALSPSHPFTSFDKWRLIWEIDDGYNVVGTIETFF
jgi:D-serine dehydratase